MGMMVVMEMVMVIMVMAYRKYRWHSLNRLHSLHWWRSLVMVEAVSVSEFEAISQHERIRLSHESSHPQPRMMEYHDRPCQPTTQNRATIGMYVCM